jgi:RNA polymerase sigma-70 factor (ECF subfamily)
MSTDDLTASRLSRNDELLMQRLREGDSAAIAAVERRFGDELRLFCRRMLNDGALAEDVVQDVLTTCCRLRADSLPTHSIRGWLYQVARRRCIDMKRKRRDRGGGGRADRDERPDYDYAIDPLTTPAGRALKRDRATRVLGVLQELDDDLRSVIVMRYFQELPREEIAEAIGLSVSGTKARLSKAMSALRDKLRNFDDSQLL